MRLSVLSIGTVIVILYGLFLAGIALFLAQRQSDVALNDLSNGHLFQGILGLLFVVLLGLGGIAVLGLFLYNALRE